MFDRTSRELLEKKRFLRKNSQDDSVESRHSEDDDERYSREFEENRRRRREQNPFSPDSRSSLFERLGRTEEVEEEKSELEIEIGETKLSGLDDIDIENIRKDLYSGKDLSQMGEPKKKNEISDLAQKSNEEMAKLFGMEPPTKSIEEELDGEYSANSMSKLKKRYSNTQNDTEDSDKQHEEKVSSKKEMHEDDDGFIEDTIEVLNKHKGVRNILMTALAGTALYKFLNRGKENQSEKENSKQEKASPGHVLISIGLITIALVFAFQFFIITYNNLVIPNIKTENGKRQLIDIENRVLNSKPSKTVEDIWEFINDSLSTNFGTKKEYKFLSIVPYNIVDNELRVYYTGDSYFVFNKNDYNFKLEDSGLIIVYQYYDEDSGVQPKKMEIIQVYEEGAIK